MLPFTLLKAAKQGSRLELRPSGRFPTMCRRGPGRLYETIYLAKTAMLLVRRGLQGVSARQCAA